MYCRLHNRVHQHYHRGCARRSPSSDSSSTSSSESEALGPVEAFKQIAETIKRDRTELAEKFPKVVWIPNKDDMEWCSFCLGTRICREIYGEETEGEKTTYYRNLPHRRLPLLSIVLHLKQDKVKLVLSYLHQWFLIKGLKNFISMWIYALLTCLDNRNVGGECYRLLNKLHKDFKKYSISCEPWQKARASLIMDILEGYFFIDVESSDESSSE